MVYSHTLSLNFQTSKIVNVYSPNFYMKFINIYYLFITGLGTDSTKTGHYLELLRDLDLINEAIYMSVNN